MTGISNPIFRSCGNKSVSIPKIRQQAKYIVIQKIYFANTISFRGNGSAHNKVDALGYCVSFKDTYCKSIKIEKIVIKTKPNMPAYSGERHIKNNGKITHGSVKKFVSLEENDSFLVRNYDMKILIEKEYFYAGS